MAQLRDIQTSEVVFEGDPIDALVLAHEVGLDQVVFDDVGAPFDPKAAWDAHQQRISELNAAAKSRAEGTTTDSRAAAKEELAALTLDADAGDAATVSERIKQARERSEAAARYE